MLDEIDCRTDEGHAKDTAKNASIFHYFPPFLMTGSTLLRSLLVELAFLPAVDHRKVVENSILKKTFKICIFP